MRNVALFIVVLVAALHGASAQRYLLGKAKMTDKNTQNSIVLSQPPAATSSSNIIFPTAVGAVGDALYVKSVSSDGIITLDWTTTSDATSSSNSTRVATDQTTTLVTDFPTGVVSPTLSAGKAYRYTGLLRLARQSSANDDRFRIRVTGPTGLSYLSFAHRNTCVSPPDSISGSPGFHSATSGTTVTTGDINPPQAQQGPNWNATPGVARCFYYEGIVVTGANSGTITITLIEPTNTTTGGFHIFANSHIIVEEIR